MLAVAAGVSLLLGIVGIYGVVACVTAQRTREVDIRVALGAQKGDVARLFVRHSLVLTGLGIGVGLVAAAALSRLLTSMLFGVGATDPATCASMSTALAGVALLAGYPPRPTRREHGPARGAAMGVDQRTQAWPGPTVTSAAACRPGRCSAPGRRSSSGSARRGRRGRHLERQRGLARVERREGRLRTMRLPENVSPSTDLA